MYSDFLYYVLDTINVITESYTLPTDEDYNGAILAIHRLEDTYLLEPKDVRSGKLSEHYPSRGLTRKHFTNKDKY